MTNLRQAAQQALEALEQVNTSPHLQDCYHAFDGEITALRAALAEPEQEPDGISWLKRDSGYFTAPTPRKPLTEEEIKAALVSTDPETKRLPPGFRDFARAIERAHGIGEQHE